jgi:hypothetical protein
MLFTSEWLSIILGFGTSLTTIFGFYAIMKWFSGNKQNCSGVRAAIRSKASAEESLHCKVALAGSYF